MQSRRRRLSDSHAVSSVVATVLLLAVTVVAFSGLGVTVLEKFDEDEETRADLEVLEDNKRTVLRHRGGDEIGLLESTMILNVAGVEQEIDLIDPRIAEQTDDGEAWHIGESICLAGAATSCLFPAGTDLAGVVVVNGNTRVLNHGTRAANYVPGVSDLLIESILFSPNPPLEGVPTTMSVTVRNVGTASTGAVPIEVEWEVDGQTFSGSVSGPLGPGQSAVIQATSQWTPAPGSHTVVGTIDPNNNIAEEDETNNQFSTGSFSVGPISGDFDLEIINLPTTPVNPQAGDDVTFNARITNTGTEAIPPGYPIVVQWEIDGQTFTATYTGGLGPGASVDVSGGTWTPGSDGDYPLTTTVDPHNGIHETDETDNVNTSDSITVGEGPNLSVVSIDTSPANPNIGDAVMFSAVIQNDGTLELGAGEVIQVQWEVDGQTFTGSVSGPLAAGASTTVTASGAWIATAGTHSVTTTVDPSHLISEQDETDNVHTTGSVTVSNISDPGDPFHDVDGDGVYEPGDGDELIPAALITSGHYHATGNNGLVIPPSVGPISADEIHFKSKGNMWIYVDVTATDDDRFHIESDGSVFIRDVTFTAQEDDGVKITCDDTAYLEDLEIISEGKIEVKCDALVLDRIDFHAKGSDDEKVTIEAEDGSISGPDAKIRSKGDIEIDAKTSISMPDAFIETYNGDENINIISADSTIDLEDADIISDGNIVITAKQAITLEGTKAWADKNGHDVTITSDAGVDASGSDMYAHDKFRINAKGDVDVSLATIKSGNDGNDMIIDRDSSSNNVDVTNAEFWDRQTGANSGHDMDITDGCSNITGDPPNHGGIDC